MTLNLTYLKYFFDAIRLGGITASAKENFVSQSAVSQGIMKLELHFKKKLLTHQRNSIKLTEDGESLFHSCRNLFRYIDEIQDSFIRDEFVYKGKLEFGSYYSINVSFLPKPLAKFQELAPLVTPRFISGRNVIVLEALNNGDVEFGIVMGDQDLSNFDCEKIYSGHFGLYESAERKGKKIEKCIFAEQRPETLKLKESFQRHNGYELNTQMEVGSLEVLVNLIISNVGVGFIPDYLVKVPHRKGLLRKCKVKFDPIPYDLFVVVPKGEILSKNAKLFIECIKEEARLLGK